MRPVASQTNQGAHSRLRARPRLSVIRRRLEGVAFAASLNKRFAPIVCRRVDEKAVPEALRRLNFIFFDDEARFEQSAEKLADALSTDIDWIRKDTDYGEQTRR